MKAITTRSGVAYEGPSIPTNPSPKRVVERETEETTDKEQINFQGSSAHIPPPVNPIPILEPYVPKTLPKPNIPYPSRLDNQKLREKASFAPTIRNLLMNKEKLLELAKIPLNDNCSAMLLKKLPEKLGDPDKFLIPCDFPGMDVYHALTDLGASINLMPLSIWKKLSLPELTPTRMTLELADRSITHPKGLAEDVYVKVGKFHFPTDFVVVDFKVDPRVPLILGRSFLRTGFSNKSSGGNPTPTSEPLTSEFILEEIEAYLKDDSISLEIDHADCDPERDICLIENLSNNDPFQLPPMDIKQENPWVSPVHCVPKKGGITVVANEENELILTRLVTGWRVCIDYRKLNKATRKDHFPLPFMDQMLERLARNEFYCFLDGFSGYFQIPIDPQDQEKTTFTCPYRTFAYRRMPFGLCNAPGTFQRCMMVIFYDMIEKIMEVFMDDFRGLHAQVRTVQTDKGTEFLNKTLYAYFAKEGIRHETSTARTPEQHGVVERRNRTLIEAARTMLSAAKVPLFFWAEAIATTCFTQNRSLVIPRHEKTPYHIINGRKPFVKFFHIFGSLCYIIRDGENLDKMKEKGDASIFVGYSTQSRAYRVFNKRTRIIVETIHVNFDELPQMASDHVSSDPVPQCSTTVLEQDSLSPDPQSQENVTQTAETVTTSNELDLLFSPMFDELLNGTTLVVSKSSAVHAADAPDKRQHQNITHSSTTTVVAAEPPLNIHTTPQTTNQAPTQVPTVTA
ncbi:reverse transcriptase domain-containing protein, partial [Tanacetum coccineum]